MATDLILGTAGHIDHGKTALVRALTGVDTDRLPEEKKRGITIELGFAQLALGDYRLGIVDVPGHERFVRNMLAGATGVDLVLLVVAADDSVKPQTREHLDILRLLDLPAGVIALTKCDVADESWVELVEAEVRELVTDTFLDSAPIVRTSAFTGEGIDQLKAELTRAAQRAVQSGPENRAAGPFRMAIDRVFSIAGHGTVVTGSVLRGCTSVGDELVIEPGGWPVRVRGLQNHDEAVETVQRGQRAAINLAGVHHNQIDRGHELATPGFLKPSQLLTVELGLLPGAQRPLKNRRRVRLHVGTAELMASVVLHDIDEVPPGGSALAQLFLSKPAVTTWGQPFVIRSESPVATIGGGRVLAPTVRKLRRGADEDWSQVEQLRSPDPLTRAAAAVYFAAFDDWHSADLARAAGVDDPERTVEQLLSRGDTIEPMRLSATRTLRVHRRQNEQLRERILAALSRLHDENPRDLVLPVSSLATKFAYLQDDALYKATLKSLAGAGQIEVAAAGIALPGRGPKLSKNERKLLDDLVARYQEAGRKPPTVAEIKARVDRNQAAVPKLIELASALGHLDQLSADLFMHRDAVDAVRSQLSQAMAGGQSRTVSEIREILDTTRKYAIPLCEYLDETGFTRRDGDVRVLTESSSGELAGS